MTYPYHKHKREIRNHKIIIVILIAIILILLFRSPNIATEKLEGKTNIEGKVIEAKTNIEGKIFTSFKDFNENPEKYVGKNITIKGKHFYLIYCDGQECTRITDNNDYFIRVIIKTPRMFHKGRTYTFSGTIIKVQNDDFCRFDDDYPFSCNYEYYLVEE